MKRTRAILTMGILGVGATLLSAVPAGAFPWGHDQSGTNMQAQNCNCTAAEQAATQAQQLQAASSKQNGPAGVHNNTGERSPQR